MMWSKFQAYLRNIKSTRTDAQIAEEAWDAVRDAIYVDTPYHAFISALITQPTEKELEVAVSQWKSVTDKLVERRVYIIDNGNREESHSWADELE